MGSRAIKEGWLLGYREYTAQSEAPEPFHLWTGMSVLSAALRRHVWINQGYYVVYPNLYVVLVAPPGACKKSVAINIGLRIARKVPGLNIESNKMTPASLIHTLNSGVITATQAMKQAAKTPQTPEEKALEEKLIKAIKLKMECSAMLVSTEFSVMLGADSTQNGMLALLTDLYDSPERWSYKTMARGVEEIHNVFLSILAATTPDWLGNSIPADAIGGGFTSRILFCAQTQKRHDNPRPKLTQKEADLEKRLVEDLTRISEIKGEVVLTDAAEKFYDEWYRNRNRREIEDERFWGYLERKPDHLLKIAIIIAVSFSDDLVVDEIHFKMGLEMLNRLEQRMSDAFIGVGKASGKDIVRIVKQIEEAGGRLDYTELMRKNYRHLNSQELELVLATMAAAGMVIQTIQGKTRTIVLNAFAKKAATP